MKWLQKPLPAALILVFLWTICRLASLAYTGIRQPQVTDEFSYLLGADTFAHGRLANPPLPNGKFFESPQELVRPVYASKYPPGQAMFLALGQALFGAPIYGVLIGNSLMLFTFCLMLFAWVPPPWALAVSVMFGLILSPAMYWTTSYVNGSVAASGGALVLLSIGMYRGMQTLQAGAVFAVGVLLLFWTRPYEGGVFTLMVLIVFARELWQRRRAKVLVGVFSVLAMGGAWTCYYNYAVTGNPLLLPYLLDQRQYDVQRQFWFLPLRHEPTYSHPRLAAYYGTNGYDVQPYEANKPRWKLFMKGLIATVEKLEWSLRIAVLFALLVPVAWPNPVYRKMVAVTGVFLLALSMETYHNEHYSAPVWAALALMIAVWAERAWNLRWRGLPAGIVLVALALASPVIVAVVQVSVAAANQQLGRHFPKSAASRIIWSNRRAALIQRLSALDRRQLVLIRYPSPDWHVENEWVYNSADIDNQRVVLAHDLGTEENRELLNYYPHREAWLLTFDPVSEQEHLEAYPQSSSQQ